jgi:hypothetical protein
MTAEGTVGAPNCFTLKYIKVKSKMDVFLLLFHLRQITNETYFDQLSRNHGTDFDESKADSILQDKCSKALEETACSLLLQNRREAVEESFIS